MKMKMKRLSIKRFRRGSIALKELTSKVILFLTRAIIKMNKLNF